MAERRITLHGPITRDGRYTMACDRCAFIADSDARSPEAAEAEARRRHRHHDGKGTNFVVTPVDYTEHPLFVGRFTHEDRRRPGAPPREATR